MRRILIVVGLVVLLAAVIVVPAVATPAPQDRDSFLSSIFGNIFGSQVPLVDDIPALKEPVNGLRASLGLPPVDDDGVVISPVDSNGDSGVFSSSNTSASEDPGVSQEFSERRIQSGSASPSSSFSNSGDNVNACPTNQQVVNTGNVANQQGVTQYNSTDGDIDVTGSSVNITSDQTVTCDQTLNQAAEAGQ
jgi:hypothetical protein